MNNLDRAKLLERQWDNKKCGLGRQNWIKVCALELKEKVEKGCGKDVLDNNGRPCLPCGDVVGEMGDYVKAICKECIEKEKSDLDRVKELREELIRLEKYMSEPYLVNRIKEIKQEAKQLKEKVEKGCGAQEIEIEAPCDKYNLCKDCYEPLKILNEILGEKE